MAVLGNIEIARRDLSSGSPLSKYLEQAGTAAHRAADLTRQMLAYSGKGQFLIREIDLSALVGQISGLLSSSIPKSVSLDLNLALALPPVRADVAQMQQIIMNLVINAGESYGPDEGGIVAISTCGRTCDREMLSRSVLDVLVGQTEPLPEGMYVELKVSDTGCGMDEETKKRVFEPFFTTKFTGRGLGMAAVSGIVRAHKGALLLDSEPGVGTTFRVLLPAEQGATVTAPQGDTGGRAAVWRGSGTVLVVDDEEQVLALVQRMVERLGFTVLTAANGSVALEICRERLGEIRCIVVDVSMPGMGGEEVLREVRELDPAFPVILSSGYSRGDVVKRFPSAKAAGFIQKPYQMDALAEALRSVLRQ